MSEYCPRCGIDWDGKTCRNCGLGTRKSSGSVKSQSEEKKEPQLPSSLQKKVISKSKPPGAGLIANFMMYLVASIVSFIAALLGAAVWIIIAVVANLNIGWLALLIGFLSGFGAALGARLSRFENFTGGKILFLSAIAVFIAVFCVYVSQVVTYAYFGVTQEGLDPLSSIAGSLIIAFPVIPKFFLVDIKSAIFDLIFYLLAIITAYKEVPRRL